MKNARIRWEYMGASSWTSFGEPHVGIDGPHKLNDTGSLYEVGAYLSEDENGTKLYERLSSHETIDEAFQRAEDLVVELQEIPT